MQYAPYHPLRKYTSPVFDPLSTTAAALATVGGGNALTGGAMALSGLSTGLTAANSIASGGFNDELGQMKQAQANFAAAQDIQNAAGETAAAQRQAIGVSQKANLQRSSAVADAAAGGVEASTGSALTNQAQIAGRGSNEAGFDLWQGQNRAVGLQNQAAGQQYSGYMDLLQGEEAQRSSYLNAASTIAGGGASLLKMYGDKRPNPSLGVGNFYPTAG
jgi:hypothetical protein